MTAEDLDAMLAAMNIREPEIVRLEENWSERLGGLISATADSHDDRPGGPVHGDEGGLWPTRHHRHHCLGLVFFSSIFGLADHTELLLMALGIGLLAAEIFVLPGFGIAGISGILCLAVGMLLSFQDFVLPDPAMPWQQELLVKNLIQVLGSFLFASVVSLLFLRYIFPRTALVAKGPYLSETLASSRADSVEAVRLKPGDSGTALTLLRPSGKARFGTEVFDVISEAEFLEKDTEVVVRAIKGNRLS
jgi:membrane-bound serine protease (ClpP class)